jgi:hypothetical protein
MWDVAHFDNVKVNAMARWRVFRARFSAKPTQIQHPIRLPLAHQAPFRVTHSQAAGCSGDRRPHVRNHRHYGEVVVMGS